MSDVLPDVLGPGLALVICGSAAGTASARAGAYYAGPGNRFWWILAHSGLTERQLEPHEFALLPNFGVGLTDLAKRRSGSDAMLGPGADDPAGLAAKIESFAPRALAFNGKRAARVFLGAAVPYGRRLAPLGDTALFVLPSTSGAARRYWDEAPWLELAAFVRKEHGVTT
ncbi:MAG: mismatch-specific DNA-glycosylase [Alphaproteobacteria bacterium]|mgnify:CR=1 FL=1|jgi:TDG/mug DNA glycosylase family protein|nr:mismatch-specific DNA-glycosylase [Rhodospirillaceae bacterium]MDP6406431.1 mismatch-specific DNA-glycosylase [Alphaproteobacteria bacterium]MDP6621863.1 mismatch-specific DNA-glycosylase [Alphaproteobacteria bacterium]|tara:strand:+ start:722 stop:1231 length:510 start_codon:yes stop_codon:yes gene_type:complete